jgi:hypothetical protein
VELFVKRCRRCRELKPESAFRPEARQPDELCPWCHECKMEYQRQKRTAGVAEVMPPDQPDRDPAVVLREALEQQRRLRNQWTWAWSVARTSALLTISATGERMAWELAFLSTKSAWEAAYLQQPEKRLDALAALAPTQDDGTWWPSHPRERPLAGDRDWLYLTTAG